VTLQNRVALSRNNTIINAFNTALALDFPGYVTGDISGLSRDQPTPFMNVSFAAVPEPDARFLAAEGVAILLVVGLCRQPIRTIAAGS
jgi:hypothetical protein